MGHEEENELEGGSEDDVDDLDDLDEDIENDTSPGTLISQFSSAHLP